MASYAGITQRFNTTKNRIDLDYIDRTLKEKQNTIDTNYGFFQQNVEKVLGQDLVGEHAKKDLKDKLSNVINTLADTGSVNFGSKKSRYLIQSELNSVVKDPKVSAHISVAKKYREAQEFYSKRSAEGTLNNRNYEHAMNKMGMYNYLKEGDPRKVGDFRYLEYTDQFKLTQDAVAKLKKDNPNQEVSFRGYDGVDVTKKVSQMTDSQIREVVLQGKTQTDWEQMAIDAEYSYYKGSPELAATMVAGEREVLAKEYASEISKYETLSAGHDVTKGLEAKYKKKIKSLIDNKSAALSNFDTMGTSMVGAKKLFREQFNSLVSVYNNDGPVSKKVSTVALKHFIETGKKLGENTGNSTAGPSSTTGITSIPASTNLEDMVDYKNDVDTIVDNSLAEYSSSLMTNFNKLDGTHKEGLKNTMDAIKNDKVKYKHVYKYFNTDTLTNEQLQWATLNELGPGYFPDGAAGEIRKAIAGTMAITSAIENFSQLTIDVKGRADSIAEQLTEEEDIRIFNVGADGEVSSQRTGDFIPKGIGYWDLGETNAKDFLNSKGKYKNASYDDKRKLLANNHALQSILFGDSPDHMFGVITSKGTYHSNFEGGKVVGSLSREQLSVSSKALENLTGSSLEDVFVVKKQEDGYSLHLDKNKMEEHPSVGKLLKAISDAQVSGLGFYDSDRTAGQESGISSLYEKDSLRDFAQKNLDLYTNRLAVDNKIRVSAENPVFEEILAHTTDGKSMFTKKVSSIDLAETEGGWHVYETTKSVEGNKNGEGYSQVERNKTFLSKESLKNMPEFNKYIKTEKDETLKSTFKDLGVISQISFVDEGLEAAAKPNSRTRYINETYKSNDNLRPMAFKEEARKKVIADATRTQLGKFKGGADILAREEEVFTNTDRFALKYNETSGNIDVLYKGENKDSYEVISNPAASVKIGGDSHLREKFLDVYVSSPQIVLAFWLRNEATFAIQKQLEKQQNK